jgi:hypothetical protein
MRYEGVAVPREDFVHHLRSCLADKGFCTDLSALLRQGVVYDPQIAGQFIEQQVLGLLPT